MKRSIHGVLLLDKPLGWSSNHAVQKIKRLYQATKVGHTGTLDPLATGMLALCLGEATKFGQCLLEADKQYHAIVQLGQTTTTGDSEGDVLVTQAVPSLTNDQLTAITVQFTGQLQQIPPMFSALKVNGQALYHLARLGQEVPRAARAISIYALCLTRLDANQLSLTVHCSKGTYIRTLAEDIGAALGCGAHLIALKRTAIAALPIDAMLSYEQLVDLSLAQLDEQLLPIDSCVAPLVRLDLKADEGTRLLWGQTVQLAIPQQAGVRKLYDEKNQFLGLAEWCETGQLLPQRLINPVLLC